MAGWVSFHRQIMKWEWYTDPNTFRLFFHLVLNANHEKGRWKGNDIERGQLITSSDKLAMQLELSRQQIRTALKKLESTNEITIKPTNKYTLVTVANYDFYQSEQGRATNNVTNEQPTNNHQITTNNNDNNKKNEKELKKIPPKWSEEDTEYKISLYLYKQICKNNENAKEPNFQTWSSDADKMIRLDERTTEDIKTVIDFSQNDNFWKSNILSVGKLRKQFDQLLVKSKVASEPTKPKAHVGLVGAKPADHPGKRRPNALQ